jgi:parallel beta-helix repeat protein
LGLPVLGAALVLFAVDTPPAGAFNGTLSDWQEFYNNPMSDPPSASGDDAVCQLCHTDATAGDPWNAYGWAIVEALVDNDCDLDDDGVDNFEAFFCVEGDDSDNDPGANDNLTEIEASTQPGWTDGPLNPEFPEADPPVNSTPPAGIPLDPDGTGGTGGGGGTGGTAGGGGTGGGGGSAGGGGTGGGECDPGHDRIPPGQFKRGTIVVKEGQSIQEAIDRAQEGTRIFVHAGVYEEPCNTTNGLNITKSGIHLIGQSNKNKRVIIQSTNGQRNGIVITPPDVSDAAQPQGRIVETRTDCMSCHTDMAPPFPLHPDVPAVVPTEEDPYLYDIKVESITIRDFVNNGLWTEHVDGFVFDDIESINNSNYGIFPVLSKNGVITNSYSTGSDLDSALWVETSVNVLVEGNLVENSVNGIEVSNSDDILVINNEMRGNSIGAAILLLPDIYDDHDSAKGIHLINNWVHDNNKTNTARPGSILASIPRGQGILYVGVDESVVSGNLVENNHFVGIAIVDYCLPFQGTDFDCSVDPTITPEFLADQAAENNSVVDNISVNNGTNPDEDNPFPFAAADLTLLTLGDHNNCFQNNIFNTAFSTIGVLPPCAP